MRTRYRGMGLLGIPNLPLTYLTLGSRDYISIVRKYTSCTSGLSGLCVATVLLFATAVIQRIPLIQTWEFPIEEFHLAVRSKAELFESVEIA